MKPRFTADEAVAIIKTARGKNCKKRQAARKKKLRSVAKMAQLCGRAKTPMEKKAFPVGLALTLASFAPEILKGLKWGGRGLGLLKKVAPLAKGVKGLTGAQRLGGGIYRGIGAAGGGLGKLLSGAGGKGKLGQGARWLGGKISPWAKGIGQQGSYAGRLAANPAMAHGRRLDQALGLSKGLETTGRIARGVGPALMGLGALAGTGGGDEMPQWANSGGPRLGSGMGNRLPPQLRSYLMGM